MSDLQSIAPAGSKASNRGALNAKGVTVEAAACWSS
jgi:hypothetical protein